MSLTAAVVLVLQATHAAPAAGGSCTELRGLEHGTMPSARVIDCARGIAGIVAWPDQPATLRGGRLGLPVRVRHQGASVVYRVRALASCSGKQVGESLLSPDAGAGLAPGATSAQLELDVDVSSCPAGAPLELHVVSTPTFVRSVGEHGSAPGQLSKPHGIALLPGGAMAVADRGNNRVQVFDRKGGHVLAWGSLGTARHQFDHPEDVELDRRARELHVCDMNNACVKVFDLEGRLRRVIRARAELPLDHPLDIALSPDGRTLYVADNGNFRVVRFSSKGKQLGSWGGFGQAPGQFRSILDIEAASDGRVFVSDAANRNVQVFGPTGEWIASVDGSQTDEGRLTYPAAVLPVGKGHVFVADFNLDRVLLLGLDGTVAGWFGRSSDAPGGMRYPHDLELDGMMLHVTGAASDRMSTFDLGGWEAFEAARRTGDVEEP